MIEMLVFMNPFDREALSHIFLFRNCRYLTLAMMRAVLEHRQQKLDVVADLAEWLQTERLWKQHRFTLLAGNTFFRKKEDQKAASTLHHNDI